MRAKDHNIQISFSRVCVTEGILGHCLAKFMSRQGLSNHQTFIEQEAMTHKYFEGDGMNNAILRNGPLEQKLVRPKPCLIKS